MGGKSMFELENAIQEWKNQLLQRQTMNLEDIDELEGHLREEVDHLILTGLSEEEAFLVACHRIGDNSRVAREYAKVNTREIWQNRVFWMLFGLFLFLFISSATTFLSGATKVLFASLDMNPTMSGIVSSLLCIIIPVSALILLVVRPEMLSGRNFKRRKIWRVLTAGILMIFSLRLFSLLMTMMQVRMYGASDIGMIALASNYVNGSWSIIWPIVLAGLMLWMKPKSMKFNLSVS